MAKNDPFQGKEKANRRGGIARWKAIVAEFQQPDAWRANWQIANTVGEYVALWFLMYLSFSGSYQWLTVSLAILAGGFLIRIFIIFHDCGHESFFKSRTANDFLGFVTGLLTFTP